MQNRVVAYEVFSKALGWIYDHVGCDSEEYIRALEWIGLSEQAIKEEMEEIGYEDYNAGRK